MYRILGQRVFITAPAKWDRSLAEHSTAKELVRIMGRVGQKRKTHIHAYCIMPNHIHVVISAEEGGDLEGWLRYMKREAAKALKAPGMWQRSYWDRRSRKSEDVVRMVAYTLNNPVRWRLCERWDEWPFSWSQWHPQTRGADPNVPEPTKE